MVTTPKPPRGGLTGVITPKPPRGGLINKLLYLDIYEFEKSMYNNAKPSILK